MRAGSLSELLAEAGAVVGGGADVALYGVGAAVMALTANPHQSSGSSAPMTGRCGAQHGLTFFRERLPDCPP